ncbi:MAG: shikimate dehydrogenase [Oscillospiraceae bacterium]|nr:shikimate dehydrogenase [Oscillospiraceae bacterium]
MEYGLIGEKLGHSYSAEIHPLLGYNYELKELKPEEVEPFLKKRDFKGINVTIPYKQVVMKYLDEIDDKALEIGAVNTICNRDGKLCGYNTDFVGMKALIKRTGVSLNGKRVLIAGSGGTSKTAAAVAKSLGAASVYRLSRSEKEGCITYKQAENMGADFFINTTPCGMYPNVLSESMDINLLKDLKGMVDAVYNPLKTVSVKKALKRGLPAEGGLYMLVVQAVAAAEKFLDKKISQDETERIYNIILKSKEEKSL